ncbi:hypothetical protein [Pectobacterium brasiliense]|uniref:hypothetical protein n=1 Tax=Pectobacterium brasiliense TaxID=180957 RepID=UPI000CE694E6|nr:hypothetical protein [Pectobacterium brasiliense]
MSNIQDIQIADSIDGSSIESLGREVMALRLTLALFFTRFNPTEKQALLDQLNLQENDKHVIGVANFLNQFKDIN